MKTPIMNVSSADFALIVKIVERYAALCRKNKVAVDFLSLQMDLTACHANGCPLDLTMLLGIEDLSFAHDIYGIRNNLDRSTGKLGAFFLPRCAMREVSHEKV